MSYHLHPTSSHIFTGICALYIVYAIYKIFVTTLSLVSGIFQFTKNLFVNRPFRHFLNRRQQIALRKIKLKEEQKKAAYRLEHYFYYEDRFVNIGFIEEDRKLLFNGHDQIKWRWGKKSINNQSYSRQESHKLCHMMFLEMSIYRDQFIKHGNLWTDQMEILWQKMLPPNYKMRLFKDRTDVLRKIATEEYESDDCPKKIAS